MKINVSMDRGKQVETCLVIVTGLIVFWFVFDKKILLTIALFVGITGAFVPFLAKWIHWAWYKLAEVMDI